MPRPAAPGLDRHTKLKEDDPLPETLEQMIIDMQTALIGTTSKLAQGRPLSKEEVLLLQVCVAGLHEELDLVEFASPEIPKAEGPFVSFQPHNPATPNTGERLAAREYNESVEL